MRGLLVRVGADQTLGGGRWNGPVDTLTGRFAYVPIPEGRPGPLNLVRHYAEVAPAVESVGVPLPPHLQGPMHLDPDFEHLTYGDRGAKGRQLQRVLGDGGFIIFYSGLRCTRSGALVYAIIGYFQVDEVRPALSWAPADGYRNAHTRRHLAADADDVIAVARSDSSGRLATCLPIGEYRDRAYRVRSDLLVAWGGVSARDGYLQRSAVFPELLNPSGFLAWWRGQSPALLQNNWDG